jgi:hypothetical protein
MKALTDTFIRVRPNERSLIFQINKTENVIVLTTQSYSECRVSAQNKKNIFGKEKEVVEKKEGKAHR